MAKENGKKNPIAVMMGLMSAERMTPAQRTQRARTAALARWHPKKKKASQVRAG